ncbi:N-acetylmuramoyl-L-alanine amidase CwlD [Tepidibacter thalassicus]|uniref:N-acetylmuramoyl-L-alanine amidase n=1 Tax=Tepidibacter thalassicus DSM 15285 TaxID=1123350 RepID=A0A1M5T2L2_9FIRM|nr:N-acetylmuramoyl-L-alanine amidase CwlD [Tepidibacter thalassicus]SHH44918.1 N-acetylmuramoyl-L-alanine amidase [Tepidibacter thalassicus DSM 15285]
MIIFLKKKYLYVFVFLMVLLGIIALINHNTSKTTINMPVTNKVIIIDAGHGGIDPGALGKTSLEKNINLKITLKVRELLEESGALVLLTREKDESLYIEDNNKTIRQKYNENLRNRKRLIKESKADVFISIHLNSFINNKYYGAQTLYPKNDEESKKLALLIQEELKRVLDKSNNRQPKGRDDLYLLKGNSIPSVLIECGFLSNSKEEELLKRDDYQNKIAWAIYIGIQKYFNAIN